MRGARTASWRLVLPLLALAGCGGGEVPGPGPGARAWGAASKEYVALRLPEAVHARWTGRLRQGPVVNLLASGDIAFRGRTWPLATADAAERERSLAAFHAVLGWQGEGPGASVLQLHADRDARWVHVEAVLREALAALPLEQIRWNVRHDAIRRDICQAADVAPLGAVDEAWPVVELHARPAPRGREVRLVVGSWSVAEADGDFMGDDEPWVGDAGAFRDRLGSAEGIVLRAFDESEGGATRHVAWGHVVGVTDALLGGRVRRLALPDLGVRCDLLEPEALGPAPYAFPDDPVVTPLVIVLAVLAVLAAFVATFAPLVLARSARKRPRGS